MCEETRRKFLEAIIDSDRDLANLIIDDWSIDKGYEAAVIHIVEPVIEKLGEMWIKRENISFAQVYVSAKIAEDILMKALQSKKNDTSIAGKGTIILGNIQDDYHSLGRRLISIFLRAEGWTIYDLGNDVTPKEFVDKAVEVEARIIGVSAMMYTTALNIKNLRDEIDSRGLKGKIMLAVGGAIFNIRPELVSMVGGDGTCRNAIESSSIMDELLLKSHIIKE